MYNWYLAGIFSTFRQSSTHHVLCYYSTIKTVTFTISNQGHIHLL